MTCTFVPRKIIEREDELFIVQNIVKSLVVSEEKVRLSLLHIHLFTLIMVQEALIDTRV